MWTQFPCLAATARFLSFPCLLSTPRRSVPLIAGPPPRPRILHGAGGGPYPVVYLMYPPLCGLSPLQFPILPPPPPPPRQGLRPPLSWSRSRDRYNIISATLRQLARRKSIIRSTYNCFFCNLLCLCYFANRVFLYFQFRSCRDELVSPAVEGQIQLPYLPYCISQWVSYSLPRLVRPILLYRKTLLLKVLWSLL